MQNNFKVGQIVKWNLPNLIINKLESITQNINDTGIILGAERQGRRDIFFTSLQRVHRQFSIINKFYIKKYEG